eukprot:TRINITY_DN1772_c0_g1_i2.p1 TRINITY_DN1772_c0_g1~~TRINITY_DN1772_c0_g1_i2.p1  ORF type:complete len:664 (-),score=198.13 TRINITY_DN1772_c0_g1_i2:87-2078(-)
MAAQFSEDELSKEMQIKILKEKLEFVNNQLEEKDRQLDHYKQLCKTLKDLVSELSGRQRGPAAVSHSQSTGNLMSMGGLTGAPLVPQPQQTQQTQQIQNLQTFGQLKPADQNKVRPPPGFAGPEVKTKPNSIKGRKVKSYSTIHDSLNEDMFDAEDAETPWRRPNDSQNLGLERVVSPTGTTTSTTPPSRSDQLQWRKPSPGVPGEPQVLFADTTTTLNPIGSTSAPRSQHAARLKKSISQSHIAQTWMTDREKEREVDDLISDPVTPPRNNSLTGGMSGMSLSQPNTPMRSGMTPSFSTTSVSTAISNEGPKKKAPSLLKKSQSMNSVYTVLEENRLDLKFPELDQMIGQIYPLSKYQQGCRFLQKKLDEKNATNTNIILNELFDHLVELLTDPFGNYLFSKLMEHCDAAQRDRIVNKILSDLLTVAFDMYGTQSLQKMMPFLTEPQIDAVVNALKPSAIALIKHNKANYLIQYCLDHLPPKHNQWVYDAVVNHMEEIARDRVGCVIVKRCIDHATPEQRLLLAQEVTAKVLALVQDPFGNYVVQHILDKYPHEDQSAKMILNLRGSVADLCVQKFSSNVVEKCLQIGNAEARAALLAELTDSDMLPQLLNDRFANFVIQTALDVATPDQRQLLVKNILPHLGRHYSPYTKRLQKKILQVST